MLTATPAGGTADGAREAAQRLRRAQWSTARRRAASWRRSG